MLIAAFIAKTWKQAKCTMTDGLRNCGNYLEYPHPNYSHSQAKCHLSSKALFSLFAFSFKYLNIGVSSTTG